MTVKQNEKGLWDVQFYYKDWTGKSVKKHKRNFKIKREAVAWVNQFTMQQAHNLNMGNLQRIFPERLRRNNRLFFKIRLTILLVAFLEPAIINYALTTLNLR